MKKKDKISILAAVCLTIATSLSAQECNLKGMATGWFTASNSNEWAMQFGGRYIPEFEFLIPLNENINIEGELSANFTGSYTDPSNEDNFYGKVKPYRAWAKISGNRFEVRAGLQKINFGSASILRPLMWFDRIDPRDPLKLTDGVYAILGRYYTLNNINFWAWGMHGNKNLKGWEIYETKDENIELGGRFQFPLPRAEIGLTYHHRKAIQYEHFIGQPPTEPREIIFPENRYAIDIKADLGIGLWIENVLVHHDNDMHPPYKNMLCIGTDYTFGIGNGLRLMAEHLIIQYSSELFSDGEEVQFTAFSANYPFSIFTSLSYISYYDWENNNLYNFINFGLTFDRFSYYIMGFINPARFGIFDFSTGPNLFNGNGIQVMAVYNY
ncbi:MAG: hypothetical protein U9N72_01480 [Bacteroidota bacterium]|nr:hypothetical protein [Bacteroidota bacterium]